MFERQRYPAGVPCWVDTAQPEPEAALAFYGALLGWDFEDRNPPGAPGRYFAARLRGYDVAAIGSLPPEAASTTAVWTTYIAVDDVDDTVSKVADTGGRIVVPPMDAYEAGRMAACVDPAGAAFSVWQAKQRHGAQLVNEPGTWNWSNLNANDVEQARRFYGAAFGWELNPVDFGAGVSWMIRVPGYANFLESLRPGIRVMHRQGGAPEGFTDAIGWLQPITCGQSPHWSVTFSVSDADATASAAAKLGGEVRVPPMDVPYARVAVLSDPQGAVFTASQFKPPSSA